MLKDISKKILITGADGFLGSHLSKRLLDEGCEVYGIDNTGNGGRIERCDVGNFSEVFGIMKKINPELVIHLAAVLPKEKIEESLYYQVNAKGTYNILSAMKKIGIKKIIFTSTMNVYGNPEHLPVDEKHPLAPTNTYGLTKLMAESLCKFFSDYYGIKTVVLRFSGIFGPGRKNGAIYNFINQALANQTIKIFSDGSDLWDSIYVDDAVEAIISAEKLFDKSNFDFFNIGYGKGINIFETAEKILNLTRSKSQLVIEKKQTPVKFYFDISKAEKILNFKPKDFKISLNNFINYLKND